MDTEWTIQIVLFTTLTVGGVIATSVNFFNALRVSDWLRFTGLDGSRRIVAKGSLITSAVYLICQMVFLSVSIVGIMNPPTQPNPNADSFNSHFIAWAIIFTQGLLALAAVAAHIARSKLLAAIDHEEDEGFVHES